MENAAGMAKEQKDLEGSADLYSKASQYYRESGSGFNAAENLARAAKMLQDANPERAMEMLKESCEIFEVDDKEHYSGDTFKIAIAIFLKNKKYADCVELMKNQCRIFQKLNQAHDLHKMYLSIVVLHLYCDDVVAANKAYTEFQETLGFPQSQEGIASGELLDAFEKRNNDQIKIITNRQLFTFLDNQVTKIARAVQVSDSLVPEHRMETAAPSTITSTTTSSAAGDDDSSLM